MSKLVPKLKSLLPLRIPTGMTQYNTWLLEIGSLLDFPVDQNSIEWVVSNEIMRLPSGKDRAPQHLFVKSLRKFAANQLAAAKVMEIKQRQEEQQAAHKAAEEAKQVTNPAEDTAQKAECQTNTKN